jgi:hypothetical protein
MIRRPRLALPPPGRNFDGSHGPYRQPGAAEAMIAKQPTTPVATGAVTGWF